MYCTDILIVLLLQARWTQLVSQGGLDGLGLDQLALTLACWLSEVSSTLNSETNFLCRFEHLDLPSLILVFASPAVK